MAPYDIDPDANATNALANFELKIYIAAYEGVPTASLQWYQVTKRLEGPTYSAPLLGIELRTKDEANDLSVG